MRIKGVEINISGRGIARFYLTLMPRGTDDLRYTVDALLQALIKIMLPVTGNSCMNPFIC
jgi:hypothetical protein